MVNVDAAADDVRGCNIVIIIIFPSFLSTDIMQGVELPLPLSFSLSLCLSGQGDQGKRIRIECI